MAAALPLAAALAAAALSGAAAPDLVLSGIIDGANHQTYREAPFDVPAGVTRVTIGFDYDKTDHTVIDLGLLDPERFRGWSGGSKSLLTLSPSDATPSYLPGPVVPGRWRLLMGVPNARPGSHSHYSARIWFDRDGSHAASDAATLPPIRAEPGWYRGDLHMHSAHSDGTCLSQSGVRVPCPAFRTVDAAAQAHLDFIALSDHNTVAHFNDLRELQPYFDKLLLIPATEVTTFHGHVQAIGLDSFIDFRLGTPAVPNPDALADEAARASAILSINHPSSPSGELCMGCGWTAPATDYDRIQAVEAVNGRNADGPLSGISFWYARLNEGHHLTGVGGSDNHDPDAPDGKAPVGHPTTVVHANALSQVAILDAIRAGNVFIDTQGTRDRLLEVVARTSNGRVPMGGTIEVGGGPLTVDVHVTHAAGAKLELIHLGERVPQTSQVTETDMHQSLVLAPKDACGWIAINVRDQRDALLLVGNPIYVHCGRPRS